MSKNGRNKVFIGSTCYDLKDLRAELALALEEWGYDPVWNESPDFPIKRDLHPHDICLEVVKECDIYLLIIGERYGGVYAGEKYPKEDISITWYEAKVAFQENKEVYIFVRDDVWNEKATYKENMKNGIPIKLFHTKDKRVFDFIDFIVHSRKNNWIDQFKDSVDLKEKLMIKLKPVPRESEDVIEPEYARKLKEIDGLVNQRVTVSAPISFGGFTNEFEGEGRALYECNVEKRDQSCVDIRNTASDKITSIPIENIKIAKDIKRNRRKLIVSEL